MPKLILASLLIALMPLGNSFAEERVLNNITGDVYRFQNNAHFSIVVVTNDGVVVTDPINTEAALWLRSEISKLTDKPITHLIYSHSHGDHASGGAAFGDVAMVIAQENAPDKIDGVAPTMRVAEATSIDIGGKTIELTPLGPGHGNDLMAIVVKPESVAFIVDAVAAKRLPYRDFGNANVDDWISQVRAVEALEFDVLAGGHGPIGAKEDVTNGRIYLVELREQVLAGLKAGKSDNELASSVMMEEYKDWASYEQWRSLNVRGMARHLKSVGAVD